MVWSLDVCQRGGLRRHALNGTGRSAHALHLGQHSMLIALLALSLTAGTPDTPTTAAQIGPKFGFLTGKDLYKRCTESSPISGSYCFAYIAAVHDLARDYEVWLNVREFCVPAGVTQGDMRDVFLAFARRRPADLEGQAASVVLAALKERYRCIGNR